METLTWPLGLSHAGFLERIANANTRNALKSHFVIEIDQRFLRAYSELADTQRDKVDEALVATPIVEVIFRDLPASMVDGQSLEAVGSLSFAFEHLRKHVLGLIHSLECARFFYENRLASTVGRALRRLFDLKTMPLLKLVVLESASLGRLDPLLQTKVHHHLPFHVCLRIKLSSTYDYERIGAGIAATKASGVQLDKVYHAHPNMLPSVLAGIQLKTLDLSHYSAHRRADVTIYTNLANVLPSMTMLEYFSCYEFDLRLKDTLDDAILCIAQKLALCPCLKGLTLDVFNYSDGMDVALANIIHAKPDIKWICVQSCRDSEPNAKYTSPLLLEALATTFCPASVFLGGSAGLCIWDATFIDTLGTIRRLNVAGRKYLAKDASNVHQGVKVLEAAAGNLNDVYYHLRENALLCERPRVLTIAGEECAKRQRETTTAGDRPTKFTHREL
ncbi:hypothetical protein MPSEU_000674900 [Mayamaea pseudoterrestris]|nr:hypothetical protein MPSEU_000674900 [Mayamaea pseudoterrestris]